MLFGFHPAQAVRVPAALGGTAAVPPSAATGSLQDLVSPNAEDTRREGAEEEQQLAPLEVGGAGASGDAPAAAPAGDEGGEVERVEDAVVPPPAPSPCSPTRAEREAHEATHLPYRSWCEECVRGRANNPQHRRRAPGAEEEHRLPEVHLDYAFLRRADSEVLAKLVVLNALPSRAMQAWVVPCKGLGDQASAERVLRGIRAMGVRPPVS